MEKKTSIRVSVETRDKLKVILEEKKKNSGPFEVWTIERVILELIKE
jgi:predicted DNA-binding protein